MNIVILSLKCISLFVSGLYLIGFCWFPSLGVGYVTFDFLLPSELIGLTIIGIIELIWSIKCFCQIIHKMITNEP